VLTFALFGWVILAGLNPAGLNPASRSSLSQLAPTAGWLAGLRQLQPSQTCPAYLKYYISIINILKYKIEHLLKINVTFWMNWLSILCNVKALYRKC